MACGLCHANGPRLLRPQFASREAPLGLRDRVVIAMLGARIALSGRIDVEESANLAGGEPRRVGFLPSHPRARETLHLAACTRCHGGSGPLARSPLLRAHFLPVGFLTKEGAMPPGPSRLAPQDLARVRAFYGELLGR